jgi:hypothetical protein
MAASTFVPARQLPGLAPSRRAGAELAPVIELFASPRPAGSGPVDLPAEAPGLRLVAPVRTLRSRRILAWAVATLMTALVLGFGMALAGPAVPAVDGHVVLQPGETLWDLAVRSAPPGVDARRQLADIRAVNDLGQGPLAAWTVVLLPAR